jgi:hypothetical protein
MDAVWISSTGEVTDECIGRDLTRKTLSYAGLQQEVTLLGNKVTCKHAMHFMGRPELSKTWTSVRTELARPVLLKVVPHNETFYPSVCSTKGLSIAYYVKDSQGNSITNLDQSEAVLSFTDPLSGDLLYWTVCHELPSLVPGGYSIAMGYCKTSSFCPGTDVEARVAISWPGGNSVQGSHILKAAVSVPCPPSSSWLTHVELMWPDIPYFPMEVMRVQVRSVNTPTKIVGFRFKMQLLEGATFKSLSSRFITSSSIVDHILSVEGDNFGFYGDEVLCEIEIRQNTNVTGLQGILQVVPHSFRVTLENHISFEVLIRTQGFSCGDEQGVLMVLLDSPRITTVIAEPNRKQMVHWRSLQEEAETFTASVETIGVWNTQTDDSISLITADCFSLDPQIITVNSCSDIRAAAAHGLGGIGKVFVRSHSTSTITDIHVLVPVSPTVKTFVSLDGLSGRFKVLARLMLGGKDVFNSFVDATPFLYQHNVKDVPVSSGVRMNGEEWSCIQGGKTTDFQVGTPALFKGECTVKEKYKKGLIPFLYTGGEGGIDKFVFSRSIIHPHTAAGVLLLFTSTEGMLWSGDTLPDIHNDRIITNRDKISLLSRAASPQCVQFRFDGLPRESIFIAVYPAAPSSLHITLSTYVLVTQHDIGDILPTQANVIEAWIILSNDDRLDILGDTRLRIETNDDLEIMHTSGIKSRTTGGVFAVTFKMEGMQCLAYTATVRVHPFSIATAELECPKCPTMLTMEDDPLPALLPLQFISSIPIDWFVLRCILVDGSKRDKHNVQLTIEGGAQKKNDRIVGVSEGMFSITTPLARNTFQMQIIRRWAIDAEILCNGVGCVDPGVFLTPPGNGAALFPFWYNTELSISTRFLLADHTHLAMAIPEGMILYVNGKETDTSTVPLLAPESLELVIYIPDVWQITSTAVTVQVHGLQFLRVIGPQTLFQIHCSRVWETGSYHVSGVLSDGSEAEVFPMFTPDEYIIVFADETKPNMFTSETSGDGWIQVTYGDTVQHVVISATLSSKYVEGIRLDFLPSDWNTPLETPLALTPTIMPEFNTSSIADLRRQILTWDDSEKGIIAWGIDFETITLVSDYYQPIVVTCIVSRCGSMNEQKYSKPINVNVIPNRQGQVDIGAETGPPLPLVAVGEIMSIPVYVFTETRLFVYKVHAQLENSVLTPVVCSSGEFPASTCGFSDNKKGFHMSGEFYESQRSGRILVGVVFARVMVDTLSHIQINVESILVDELASALATSPYTHVKAFRFAVRIGIAKLAISPHQQIFTELDPMTDMQGMQAVLEEDPTSLAVCCNVTVMKRGMQLTRVFPYKFQLESVVITWTDGESASSVLLDIMDPRLQLEYDKTLMVFEANMGWQILDTGEWGQESVVPITVQYTHPGTLGKLESSIFVTLAEVEELVIKPEVLELRRIHCSSSVFQSACVTLVATLRNDLGKIKLKPGDSVSVTQDLGSVTNTTLGEISSGMQVCIHANGVGMSDITISLSDHVSKVLPVAVLDSSIVFTKLEMADPLHISACRHGNTTIPVIGYLQDGSIQHNLQRFGAAISMAPSESIQHYPSGLIVTLLENTRLGETAVYTTVVIPRCEQLEVPAISSHTQVEVDVCLDSRRRADISTVSFEDRVELSLVKVRDTRSFFVHLRVQGEAPNGFSCGSFTQDATVMIDCAVTTMLSSSEILIAGNISAHETKATPLVFLAPRPAVLWGFVEVFADGIVSRNTIDAGRIGAQPNNLIRQLMPELPVIDTTGLSKNDPSLRGADPLFLLTERQRLVNVETYANDHEISIMFKVTDRFLALDKNTTRITCTLADPTRTLPLLPSASRQDNGDQIVTAGFVEEGWYAIQLETQDTIPALDLVVQAVSVETPNSLKPWDFVLNNEEKVLRTGKILHECPRLATDKARFVLEFHVSPFWALPKPELVSMLACKLQVAARRLIIETKYNNSESNSTLTWTTLSVSVESFVRAHQIRETVLNPSFKTLLENLAITENKSAWQREVPFSVQVTEVGRMIYKEDMGDHNISCPPGTFFSINGTYQKLPEHAHAGIDCYGMVCANGYEVVMNLEGDKITCIPTQVSLDIVWVCVTIILSLIAFVICVICCVKLSRMAHDRSSDPLPEAPLSGIMLESHNGGVYVDHTDIALAGLGDSSIHPSFNTRPWGSISEVILDDHSLMMIEGEFSPVPHDESRRHPR